MMSIRLMGEDSVDVPLWDDDGLMFTTAEELLEAYSLLGLSVELVDGARRNSPVMLIESPHPGRWSL